MNNKEGFDQIYQRACERKGDERQLALLLSQPLDTAKLKFVGDDRFLAEMTKKVFQSGFVWRVVNNKWPEFEKAFFGFDIDKILMMPDEMVERKAQDPSIIRNYTKVKSIRDNAYMIHEVCIRGGSFAEFVADWPAEDVVGLWDYLKKHGSRLGGNTGPYALRALGKDTFILSRDVERFLKSQDVFSGSSTSKRSRNQVQQFFNDMQQQSGRSLQELSQIIAYSTGDNLVFS